MSECEHNLDKIGDTLVLLHCDHFLHATVNKYKCKICKSKFLEQIGSEKNPNYYWFGNNEDALKGK